MKKYTRIAVGGTFDILHKGHEKLINETFELADEVFIGLTSNKFAINKRANDCPNNFTLSISGAIKS